MMLHTVNKSPWERNSFDQCIEHAVKGSGVLLIEDAVYGAIKGNAASAKLAASGKDLTLFVLGPDLKARGMDPANVVDGVTIVDYAGFVDLVAKYDVVNAWL